MFSAEISYQKGEKWNKTGLSFGSVRFWNILGTDIWTEEDSSTDSVSFTELFHISHIWKNVTSIWDLAVNFWENLGTTMFEKESVPFIQAHWVQQQNDSMTEGIPSTALLSVDLNRNYIDGIKYGFPGKTAVPIESVMAPYTINAIELPSMLNFSTISTGDTIQLADPTFVSSDSTPLSTLALWNILDVVSDKDYPDKWYVIIDRKHTEGTVSVATAPWVVRALVHPGRKNGSAFWNSTNFTWDFSLFWMHLPSNVFIAES